MVCFGRTDYVILLVQMVCTTILHLKRANHVTQNVQLAKTAQLFVLYALECIIFLKMIAFTINAQMDITNLLHLGKILVKNVIVFAQHVQLEHLMIA